MEKFLDKLIAISSKFAQNSVLNIIQGAFMMLMPVTMIGGFVALFNGIGIDAYQAFITSAGIKGVLNVIYQWTIGMFGVYVSFLVALQFARVHKCSKSDIAVGLVSMVCFLIVTPYVIPEEPFAPASLPVNWLGASGMFTGIIIAFVVGYIFKFCQKYNIVIKLPEQVPPMVSAQFTSIIPGAIAMILFGILNAVFAGTSLGSFHQLIYTIVSAPLNAVGANVFGGWLLMIVLYGLWFCGIHGGMTVGPIIMMLFMQLQMENMSAFQAGQPLQLVDVFGLEGLVHVDGCLGQIHVDQDAALIDPGIQGPDLPLQVGDRVAAQLLVYGLGDLHVSAAVFAERRPLVRGVLRQVPGPALVGDGRPAGLAEVVDQELAFLHLLLRQLQRSTGSVQAHGQAVVGGQDHGVLPLLCRHGHLHPLGEGRPLKC
jgi:hypothetical protein